MARPLWIAVLAIFTGTCLASGQGKLTLRVGGAYRTFDDVEFAPIQFRNAGNILRGPFGVQNYLELPVLFDGSGVTVDSLVLDPKDADLDSGSEWAPFIGFEIALASWQHLRLSWEGSLQYHALDASFDASRGIRGTHYNYMVMDGIVAPPPVSDGLTGFSPGLLSADASGDLEADLFILDLGLRASLPYRRVALSIAAGPVLYIADMQTSIMHGASWNRIPAADDPGFYRQQESDSGWETAFGMYGAVGLAVQLSTRVALQLDCRYDWAGQDIDSDQATLQLDGASLRLGIAVTF